MARTSDLLRHFIGKSPFLQWSYWTLYRVLLPHRYLGYLKQAEKSVHAPFDPDQSYSDMVRETIVYGTFFDEYLLYDFKHLSPKQRRSYLTDSVRNQICQQVNNPQFQNVLLDKYAAWCHLKSFYRREAIKITAPTETDFLLRFLSQYGQAVVKPLSNCAGRGVQLLATADDALQWIGTIKRGESFIVEQRILQHPSMAAWHPASVNTIRINTILRHNHYTLFNAFIRTGRGGNFVDNGAQGGIFASIDVETGRIFTDACDEYGNRFASHPDSQIPFIGSIIPQWDDLLDLARELAFSIPELAYVGWDLALTPEGWVVVEGNKGQFVAQQLTQQRGLRQEFEKLLDL